MAEGIRRFVRFAAVHPELRSALEDVERVTFDPAGSLLALATWVRLADLGVHAPEPYTLPSALALLQGEIDVAVMARADGFEEKLRAEPLYAERFVVACSAPVYCPSFRRGIVVWRTSVKKSNRCQLS